MRMENIQVEISVEGKIMLSQTTESDRKQYIFLDVSQVKAVVTAIHEERDWIKDFLKNGGEFEGIKPSAGGQLEFGDEA